MKYNLGRLLLSLILLSLGVSLIDAASFQNETLRYVISYKWGLLHKDAGEAVLSLKRQGDIYNIMLSAKTKPWVDKFYEVRDTLKGTIRISDFKPLSYTKLTHEKGEYKKDEILYSHSGNVSKGIVKRYRRENGKETVKENIFEASGPVYDMLSIFYYLRKLNYADMGNGKIYTATVFSGKEKETVKIRFLGIEKIKLKDKLIRETYHIRFNFTRKGGKKSSDDMDTWISTDPAHIPLYLVGKLPLGEVRAYFLGN